MRLGKNLGARLLNAVPIHVRKTIAFDGGAGSGATGTVAVFTLTGRVLILYQSLFCTESLTEGGATATIEYGTATDINAFTGQTNAVDVDSNEWWSAGAVLAGNLIAHIVTASGSPGNAPQNQWVSESTIITVGTQSVDDGTLVIDCWYWPITDDGGLVAA